MQFQLHKCRDCCLRKYLHRYNCFPIEACLLPDLRCPISRHKSHLPASRSSRCLLLYVLLLSESGMQVFPAMVSHDYHAVKHKIPTFVYIPWPPLHCASMLPSRGVIKHLSAKYRINCKCEKRIFIKKQIFSISARGTGCKPEWSFGLLNHCTATPFDRRSCRQRLVSNSLPKSMR